MKKLIALTVASFAVAITLYLFEATRYSFDVSGVNVRIYPAAFFGLLGLWLMIRAVLQKQTSA